MGRNSFISGVAVSALVLTARASSAETGNFTLPAGSMSWHYECKSGTQCPTKCTVQGTELVSTGNYISLTIAKVPDKTFWLHIDTGVVPVDYIFQAESVTCSLSNATLTSIRKEEAEKPIPSARQ
jgi:hypothetical protein